MRTSCGGGSSSRASTSARRAGAGSRRLSLVGAPSRRRSCGGRPAGASDRHRARPAGQPGRDPARRGLAAARRAQDVSRCRATRYCAKRDRSGWTRSRGSTPSSTSSPAMSRADVAIVGAGMAGASLAAEMAGDAACCSSRPRTSPAITRTGRSAAFWSESYGGPLIQPLTTASGPFLAPTASSSAARRASTSPMRRAGRAGGAGGGVRRRRSRSSGSTGRRSNGDARAAGRAGTGALSSRAAPTSTSPRSTPSICKRARARGASWSTGAACRARGATAAGWRIETSAGTFEADPRQCRRRLGGRGRRCSPARRRSASSPTGGPSPSCASIRRRRAELPLVIDARGRFYFKPEAGGRLWLSPHDETPCEPCDCAPEEVDVAVAIDRLEQVVDWRVERVEHSWAGLRSFAPDRLPVYGFAPAAAASSGAPARAASESRPRPPRRSWPPPCCSAGRRRCAGSIRRPISPSDSRLEELAEDSTIPAIETAQTAVRSQGTPSHIDDRIGDAAPEEQVRAKRGRRVRLSRDMARPARRSRRRRGFRACCDAPAWRGRPSR